MLTQTWRSHRPDRLVEHGEEKISVGLREAHRRSEADSLSPESAFAEQESEFTRIFDGLSAGFLAWLLGRAILHELDPEHEALAADVADDLVLALQFLEASEDIVSELEGVFLQLLLLDDLEHGLADGADDRVAAEGVEVDLLGHRGGDLRRRDDGRQRGPVADALGQRDDVRNDAMRLEAPEVRAGPTKARLDFVGDAHATGGAHVGISVLQVTGGKFDKAAHALNRFRDERGDFARRGVVDEVLDVGGVLLPGVGIRRARDKDTARWRGGCRTSAAR